MNNQVTNIANGLQQMNSFVMNNMAKVNNAIKNGSNDIVASLNSAINATTENTPTPFTTIPVILALGVLVVSFILIIVFRKEISHGFETLWSKFKSVLGLSTPVPIAPPQAPYVPTDGVDTDITKKILPGKKEVFNISQDKYTYADSEPLCKAFGAELATYEQVKDAWNNGADWCNYGWVKGQAAVYPTQQSTYDKLQQGPEDQRMACGVPGVNGGYFDNPELRFGVNCYGVKPNQNDHDIKNIMAQDNVPLTPSVLEYDRKVANYKAHQDEIAVNPFKEGTWSS